MTRLARLGWTLCALGAMATLGQLLPPSAAQDAAKGPAPADFVGPDRETNAELGCVRCHQLEFQAWQQMKHNHSLAMPQSELARGVKRALRIRGPLQRANLCQNCHFTVVVAQGAEDAKYGVSCESCHGPGKEWVPIHSGTLDEWKGQPREDRMVAAAAKGMIRPTQLYDLAENCYQCHVLAKEVQLDKDEKGIEELVNTTLKVGGKDAYHTAGSANFELLAWSNGEVRHNFCGEREKGTNPMSEFKRSLFVVGKLLDVEYTLRGLSLAKDGAGRYFSSLKARLEGEKGSLAQLKRILEVLPESLPELRQAVETTLGAVAEAKLEAGNPGLRSAADKVQASARALFNGKTAEQLGQLEQSLAPVDPLLPTELAGTPFVPKE